MCVCSLYSTLLNGGAGKFKTGKPLLTNYNERLIAPRLIYACNRRLRRQVFRVLKSYLFPPPHCPVKTTSDKRQERRRFGPDEVVLLRPKLYGLFATVFIAVYGASRLFDS